MIVDYIDEFKDQFGVEPICRALTEHGCPIAPSTYYDNRNRAPSKRALRDLEIVELIIKAREHKHRRKFGARKMWLHLRANGHDVARCTVERLFSDQGWAGVLRGKKIRTTIADAEHQRPTDLVDRHFFASRPNQLWVADFKCRRRHFRSYADLRTMPTFQGSCWSSALLSAARSA